MKKFSFILTIIFLFNSFYLCQSDIPLLSRYVNDFVGILSYWQVDSLDTFLEKYDKKTSNQIAVLIIESLKGYSLEEFSHLVATRNRIGQKGLDNGILILISYYDRKIRIEVGYGLEGIITDLAASQIIRQKMVPLFKDGSYYEGLKNAINAIVELLNNPELARNISESQEKKDGKWAKIGIITGIIVVIIMMMTERGRKILEFIFNILFLILYLFILSGGGRGSRSGGGFSGGGGFRGGGGSFGGGGASGRW